MKSRLSLAVLPVDAFAKSNEVKGDISVELYEHGVKSAGIGKRYHKKNTGHYVYANLHDGKYRIITDGMYYRMDETMVDIPFDPSGAGGGEGQLPPEKEVILEPSPYYPFPEGTTYLVGHLIDPDGMAVPDAVIELVEEDNSCKSDRRGKFVFYFSGFSENSVEFNLNIEKEGYENKEHGITVKRNERNFETVELTRN